MVQSFRPNTLNGRIIIFIGVCTLILISFSATIYWQNQATNQIVKRLEEQRASFPIIISEIESGIEAVAASQKAYLATSDERFLREGNGIWKEKINPATQQLKKNAEKVDAGKLKDQLIQAHALIQNYNRLHEQTTKLYQKNYLFFDNIGQPQDSLPKSPVRTEMGKKLQNEMKQTRASIIALLDPIRREQTVLLDADIKQVQRRIDTINFIIITLSTLIILFSIGFAAVNAYQLNQSIRTPRLLLHQLAEGELPEQATHTEDELAEVIEASNRLSQQLKQASHFAQRIGEGDFEDDFQPASKKDVLGSSLLQMRDRLREVAEEDRKRNWATKGLAEFASIIRSHSNDFQSLGDSVISALIEYVGANQGGIFIAESGEIPDTTQLRLIASYAYSRKKYHERELTIHQDYAETLLGQAYLEQEKIYIREVPQSYLYVTSGLGEATPEYLLILPLKTNDRIEGVLEIASFQDFEDYQINFIESICDNLAASIASVKISEKTNQLVRELQEQAEMMRAQEEEMRQNMEELTSTQEQMRRKQIELERLKNNLSDEVNKRTEELQASLNRFNLIIQSSSEGLWDLVFPEDGHMHAETPVHWSDNLIHSLGYQREEFPSTLSAWIERLHPEDKKQVFQFFLASIQDQNKLTPFESEHRLQHKSGEYRWFKAAGRISRDENGKPIRAAGYMNDISDQKELARVLQELEVQKQELEEKQQQLEFTNKKMRNNELVLKKAFEKAREKESQLKAKNQELEESKQKFQGITQSIPGIIFQLNYNSSTQDLRFTYLSDYVQEIFALSKEAFLELSTEDFHELIHPAERREFLRKILDSTQELNPLSWEGRVKGKRNTWRWLKASAMPLRTEENTVIFNGIFLDVTQRKLQEEKLTMMNREALAREETLHRNLDELYNVQEIMEQKQEELATVNQTLRESEHTLRAAYQKAQQQEKALEVKNKELEVLLKASQEVVLITDMQGIIQSYHPKAKDMFGYTQTELMGQNIQLLMAENLQELLQQYQQKCNSTENHVQFWLGREIQVRHQQENLFPIYLRMALIQSPHAQMIFGFAYSFLPSKDQPHNFTNGKEE